MRRSLAPSFLFFFLSLVCARQCLGALDPDPPLDNEAIVRMVAEGHTEREIIRAIQTSNVSFDLEPDMVRELRRVGVSARILDVMRKRQGVAAVSPLPQVPPPEMGAFEVRFASMNPDEEEPSFFVIREVPRALSHRMDLEARTEFDELALFVVCTDPLHVPDHWMDRTNIKQFRRHAVLGFRPGSQQAKKKKLQILQLDLSDPLSGQAPVGTHRLNIGVAGHAGSGWLVVQSDEWREATIHAGGITQVELQLSSKLRGSMMTGFQIEHGLIIKAVVEPEE